MNNDHTQPEEASQIERKYKRRLVSGVLVLLLLLIPASVHSAAAIGTLRNVPADWLPNSLALKQDFMHFVTRFGVTDVIAVSWPNCYVGSPDLKYIEDRLALLASGSASDDANVPLDQQDTRFLNKFRELCEDSRPIQWVRSGASIRDQLTKAPLNLSKRAAINRLRGTLVSNKDATTCLLISLGPSTRNHHRTLLPMIRDYVSHKVDVTHEDIAMVGGPVDGAEVDGEAIRSIERFALPTSLFATVLCWLCLRSLPLTLVVLGVGTVGQGMVLAMVYYLGIPMNAILIVLPPLVFVLTVSAGIHLSNYFLKIIREQTLPPAIAARKALQMGSRPCWLAALTTVAGLVSLMLVRLQPVQVFGGVAAVGVIGSLSLLMWMMPGAMCMANRNNRLAQRFSGDVDSGDADAHTTGLRQSSGSSFPQQHHWWGKYVAVLILTSSLVLSFIVGYGLTKLRTTVSVPAMFSTESPFRTQYRWFEKNVGATMAGDLIVTFDLPRSETSTNANASEKNVILEELSVIAKIHAALRKHPDVGGVQSALTFLPMPTTSRSLAATARRRVTRAKLEDPRGEARKLGFLDSSPSGRAWRIHLRFFQSGISKAASSNSESGDFDSAIKNVRFRAQQVLDQVGHSNTPQLAVTGHVVIVQRSQELLLEDLYRSFLAAFVLIGILMAFYLRSPLGGVLAMIPSVIPTLVLFGLMGWFSHPLDIGSLMTASLALGIAVDDSIHLVMRYRKVRENQQNHSLAAVESLRQCGGAMLQTTVVCGLSLQIYGLSNFVPTQQFALFMMGLLAIALVGVTSVFPAMMATRLGDFFLLGGVSNPNHGGE